MQGVGSFSSCFEDDGQRTLCKPSGFQLHRWAFSSLMRDSFVCIPLTTAKCTVVVVAAAARLIQSFAPRRSSHCGTQLRQPMFTLKSVCRQKLRTCVSTYRSHPDKEKKKRLTYSIKQYGIDLLRRTLDIIVLPGQFSGRAGKNTDNVPLSLVSLWSPHYERQACFVSPAAQLLLMTGNSVLWGMLGGDSSAAGEPRHRLATFRQQNP